VEGALVCAVGANDASRRELDNVVLERAAFVCCDSREQSQLESGDLIEPVERGVLDWLEVHELQEVVAGEVSGSCLRLRTSSSSSRTGSPPGTSRSVRAWSSWRESEASGESSRARRAVGGDDVFADCVDELRPVEQLGDLFHREAVRDVRVLQDLVERAPAVVLSDHVLRDHFFLLLSPEEEREWAKARHAWSLLAWG
jgi:hypothetical protein